MFAWKSEICAVVKILGGSGEMVPFLLSIG